MGPSVELAVKVLLALLVILSVTLICGRAALAIRQPRVVGEMVGGVLLGPSLFGAIAPHAQVQLFSHDVKGVLYVLSTLGLTFYMFLVGATLDHRHLSRRAIRQSSVLAVSGVLPTFVLGGLVASVFYAKLSGGEVSRLQFMAFMGGALSITAFPMLARILQERGIANTQVGLLALIGAAVDDAVAWIMLAVIVATAEGGDSLEGVRAIGGAALFAVVMLTAGRRVFRYLGEHVVRSGELGHEGAAVVILMVLGAGLLTDYVGVFSVFGGFVTGLAVPQMSALRHELRTKFAEFNSILLLPLFFAYSGLNTRFDGMRDVGLLLPFAVVLVVAISGKYLGCLLAMRLQGFSWRHSSAVGGLMNARGLMILIFINIGYEYHLLTTGTFSLLVLVAVLTTAMAMPVYRASMPAWIEETDARGSSPSGFWERNGRSVPALLLSTAPVERSVRIDRESG